MNKSQIEYQEAKEMFKDVQERFADIEEFSAADEEYQIERLLEDAKKLLKKVDRIDRKELEGAYTPESYKIIHGNLEFFKELAHHVIDFLVSAQVYNKLIDPLEDLIGQVRYGTDEQIESATKRLAGFVMKPENRNRYKSSVNAIVNGTMNLARFRKWYTSIQRLMPPSQITGERKRPEPPSKQMGNWPFKEEFVSLKKFIQTINE